MRKMLFVLIALMAVSCTQKQQGAKLEPGTPNYELAMELSEKVEWLNPDQNMVLATTSIYDVTAGDVVRQMRLNFGPQTNMLKQQNAENLKSLVKEYASRLADRQIVLDDAEDLGVTVADSSIDNIMERQFAQAGGRENFEKFLNQHNIKLEDLRQEIKAQEIGRIYIQKKNEDKLEVSESAIDSLQSMDRYATVRHVLLMTQGKPEEEKAQVRSKMEDILKQAREGEDFAELAKEYSEDPGSKEKGGLYEDFPRGQMVPPFDSAAFNLPIGTISDIVETRYGFHILQIIDRKKEDRPREALANELRQMRMRNVVEETYEKLREEYDFELKIS